MLSAPSMAAFANKHGKVSKSKGKVAVSIDDLVSRIEGLNLSAREEEVSMNENVKDMMKGFIEMQDSLQESLKEWADLEELEEVQHFMEMEQRDIINKDVTVETVLGRPNIEDINSSDEEGDTLLKSPQDVNFVAFAAQMAELETHLIEHQIRLAAGLLKQAKYEVFKATRRAKLMEKKATHQTIIEVFFFASDDN